MSQQVQKLDRISSKHRPFDIIEIFSPPRFDQLAAVRAQTCLSADLLTGWDFGKPDHRNHVKKLVKETPPELLVLCPPCTWAGGPFNLNKLNMSSTEVAEKQRLTILFINSCCDLIELQLESDNRVLFEHPKGSIVWKLPRVCKLIPYTYVVEFNFC